MDRNTLNAVLCAIAEVGDRGAPAGHLYAALMGRMSLDEYQRVEAFIVGQGLATKDGHVLTATPKLLAAYSSARATSEAKR